MAQAVRTRHLLVDLGLFAATALLAWVQRWSTTELVWSLWIASLVVGYSLIVASILGSLVHGGTAALLARQPTRPSPQPARALPTTAAALPINVLVAVACLTVLRRTPAFLPVFTAVVASTVLAVGGALRGRERWRSFPDPERGLARLVIMLPGAAFMLGFFTVHFGMFHFVHGLFLNGFFPLVAKSPFGTTPGQTLGIVGECAREALVRFWPFVAASALSRLPTYAAAWRTNDGSMMVKPYLNVVRMHVMIFVFAFLSAAGLQSYALYPLLAVYFLPLGGILALVRARGSVTGPTVPS